MIVYLSHWDWNLYKSRKDIVNSLNEKTFLAMSPEGDYTTELMETYHKFIEWKINRKKLIDIKGISSLVKNLKTLEIIRALKINEKTMITIEITTFPIEIPRKS